MKNVFGQYELTEKQTEAFFEVIGEEFDIDAENGRILHPTDGKAGHRHVDTLYASNDEETYFVSVGCSAKKITKQPFHSEKWFSPYVEVYLKARTKADEISDELCSIYNFLIQSSCGTRSYDNPKYELCLINGYEYVFVDDDKDFHDHKGYWGMFICPRFKKSVNGVGEVLFYRLIPAYKEELEFVEKHEGEANYHDLCRAIAEQIDDRQYFDISYNKLSEKELRDILISVKN